MFDTLKKVFSPVPSLEPDEARQFMAEHPEGSYTLLDVRQPGEYDKAHIAGSTLIPLPELADSVDKLDVNKPTLVYCAIGGRSRVAAQMLSGYGFEKVYNLAGGIRAWNGEVAEGPVELNLELIRGDETPLDIIRLAYAMEQSLGDFYRTINSMTPDRVLAGLVEKLAAVEDKHKQRLVELAQTIGSKDVKAADLEGRLPQGIMEGGFTAEQLIAKNVALLDNVVVMLDLSMMLETQALDLYMRFSHNQENPKTKEILLVIADEEKKHLAALGKLRGERG
jgi:sulfur-carrier protein adenylyltransferase/sulfurtransferase